MIIFIKILLNYRGERSQGKCVVKANRPNTLDLHAQHMTSKKLTLRLCLSICCCCRAIKSVPRFSTILALALLTLGLNVKMLSSKLTSFFPDMFDRKVSGFDFESTLSLNSFSFWNDAFCSIEKSLTESFEVNCALLFSSGPTDWLVGIGASGSLVCVLVFNIKCGTPPVSKLSNLLEANFLLVLLIFGIKASASFFILLCFPICTSCHCSW